MDVLKEIWKDDKRKIPCSLFRKILLGLLNNLTEIKYNKGVIGILGVFSYIHVMSSSNENFSTYVSFNLRDENQPLQSTSAQQTTTTTPDLRPICEPENLQGELYPDFDPEKLDERFLNMSIRYTQYFEKGEHMLHRQNIHFGIYLIIQSNDGHPFNKGRLMNVGFDIAKKDGFQCFFFHDVDLVPENDKNIYECLDVPRHYAAHCDKWNYTLPYNTLYGGITAYSIEAYENINGLSNEYWGWGGEDDDQMYRTTTGCGYKILRPPEEFNRYKMIKHEHEKSNARNPLNLELLWSWAWHWAIDGLNLIQKPFNSRGVIPVFSFLYLTRRY
ncbi:unnamed protein product [Oikopleura dioica]|uniref:Beta-1,4-galactosyltransferase n=1 Tax=Oikopleura dioica TaxID=34765 RepID=E4WV55_OIKDI|nr:unnamed protein product [Oikopleura dioica]